MPMQESDQGHSRSETQPPPRSAGAREAGPPQSGATIFLTRAPATALNLSAALILAAALTLAAALVGPVNAAAQNPLLEAIDPTRGATGQNEREESSASDDPMLAIERALTGARARQAALSQAVEAQGDAPIATQSASLEFAGRLVRVLEQRREARIRTETLEMGRDAIESGLSRDPREIVGGPPPFPVPILDGIQLAWQRAVDQLAQHEIVLEDRRANRLLAEQEVKRLDKERRRLRELAPKASAELERIRLENELRRVEDKVLIAREEFALSSQRVANATIEQEIKATSANQAHAALTFVQSQLSPREEDLSDALERLDRTRLGVERELDVARSQLIATENSLSKAEERRDETDASDPDETKRELNARRAKLSYRQQAVSLLSDRIERIGLMRTSWQRRYAVLSDEVDLTETPAWRVQTDSELERLTRLRRIHETEFAQTRLDLANRLRHVTETRESGSEVRRWAELEVDGLEQIVSLYERDLASLDEAIRLEERLRVELLSRMNDRSLRERAQGIWTSARSFWSYELTTSEDSPITPGKLLIGLTVFVFGLLFARLARRLLAGRVFPRVGFDAGASSAFASLTFYGLLACTFLFALRAVNIPLTAFAVAGGALAIGIGFGSQTIISNFISGLLLLAERPIRTGDLVDIAGVIGTVESIGLRSTRIRTPDNFHIIVPNAAFLESNVVNWTHEDPKIRLRVRVGVAYGSPTRKVEELLSQAAAEHPRALPHPAAVAVFLDFGDSALLFEVRFWIRYDAQTDRSKIQSDVRFRVDEIFRENGIEIAFPQVDVHLDVTRGPDGEN